MNILKKWWVKILLALAAIVLIFAALLATSSMHAKNGVQRYQEQLRAAGEKLDLKDVVPPRIDPGSNGAEFFARAFASLKPSMDGMINSNTPSTLKMVAPGKARIGWQQPEIISDFGDPVTNTWADLDQQLALGSTAIDLLRQGAERPQLDFNLDFNQGFNLSLVHLSKMKQAAILLSVAALADMHHGDSASAATNLHTLLRTLNAWEDEPLLISQLVRIAMAQIAVGAQWEFLQGTNLTDRQLATLQRDWTDMQFVQPMEQSLQMERVWGTRTIEQLRTSNSPTSSYYSIGVLSGSSGGGSGDWLDTLKDLRDSVKQKTADTLWRVSWSYDDELQLMQGEQILVETMRDVRTNGFFKNALANADHKISTLGLDRPGTNWLRNHIGADLEGLFGAGSVVSLRHALERVLNCDAACVMAGTAVALKRYQLRHGNYPPDLNALVPEFLASVPRDPVDGKPLRYRSNADGTFLLYSIGSDGVDNAGDPSGTSSKTFYWMRGRDWVWPLPATPHEIEYFRANPPK